MGRRTVTHLHRGVNAPAGVTGVCYGAYYRISTAVQSHFGYSYFISLSCNCNSIEYLLCATCSPSILSNLRNSPSGIIIPNLLKPRTGLRRVRDLCEVLWPISSGIYIQSKICLTSRSEFSPPPSCLCLKGNHGSRTDITLQSVPLWRCGLMNSQRIKHV